MFEDVYESPVKIVAYDEALISKALPYTKTGVTRLRATLAALKRVDENKIDGDFVECGVWKGGHAVLARLVSPDRKCWLYDTFTGMTRPTHLDVRRDGGKTAQRLFPGKMKPGEKWAGISLDDVRESFYKIGILDESLVRFVVGDVCETLKFETNLPDKIAVLRLDTDWYESTKIELDTLWPRLVNGGELIIDDYGHWMGARKAVDEYFGADTARYCWTDYTQITMVKAC